MNFLSFGFFDSLKDDCRSREDLCRDAASCVQARSRSGKVRPLELRGPGLLHPAEREKEPRSPWVWVNSQSQHIWSLCLSFDFSWCFIFLSLLTQRHLGITVKVDSHWAIPMRSGLFYWFNCSMVYQKSETIITKSISRVYNNKLLAFYRNVALYKHWTKSLCSL